MFQMLGKPPLIPEAERHRRWLERMDRRQTEASIDARPIDFRKAIARSNSRVAAESARHQLSYEPPMHIEQTQIREEPPTSRPLGLADAEPEQGPLVEYYVYIACYPHNRATIHKDQCHRRAKQKGERLGPFPTREAALHRAARLIGERRVHLCKRCKP
jgi:hypothetical protein